MRTIVLVSCCFLPLLGNSVKADYLYDTLDSVYTQNFDALSSVGTNNAWVDDTTLSGWLANQNDYRASDGTGNAGGLYSFGSNADRALGSIASNSTNTIQFGLRLTNDTGATLDQFTVSYDGEQWRNSGQQAIQSLIFSYAIGTSLSLASTTTAVPQLNFSGPIFSNSAGKLDGNVAPNRVAGISFQVSGVNWASGQQLLLRFDDPDSSGSDHGLAIDNFQFVGSAAVPEPSTLLLGISSLLACGYRRRNRA
jgi:hypothetical protein